MTGESPVPILPMNLFEKIFHTTHTVKALEQSIHSKNLGRDVHLSILLPPDYEGVAFMFSHYRLLLINDGQDFPTLRMAEVMNRLYQGDKIKKIIVVGIHANHDRMQEYGTAHQADYKNRGAKATQHTQFVLDELLPYLEKHFRIKHGAENTVYAGFSLGGLSAIDLVWNHPDRFSKVGVFAGSLWWRKKAYEEGYADDTDRIMQAQVRAGIYKPNLKFWFEAGTEEETSDRNNNGVIDAIDDTLDLIKELEDKGYTKEAAIKYVEVQGGKHNQETWSAIMPDFLVWAFGR